MHRTAARREPAPRRHRGDCHQGPRRGEVLHRAELVPRRRARQGRSAQPRHQARRPARRVVETLVDTGGDRLCHHVEIPLLHTARRQLRGGVLLRSRDEQLSGGGHGNEDDTHGTKHEVHHNIKGHLGRPLAELIQRSGARHVEGSRSTQLLLLRLPTPGQPLRCPHLPIHGHTQQHGGGGARGDDIKNLRSPTDVL